MHSAKKKKKINYYCFSNYLRKYCIKNWKIRRKNGILKTSDVTFLNTATEYVPFAPGLISGEHREMYIENSGSAICALNLLQQGEQVSQRIGNKIAMKSLRWRFSIRQNLAFATNDNPNPSTLRFLIIYDRQPPQLINYPNISNILTQTNIDGTTTIGTCWDNLDVNNPERYHILYDKFIVIGALLNNAGYQVTLGPMDQRIWNYTGFINLKGLETIFKSGASPLIQNELTSIITGALYVAILGDTNIDNADYFLHGVTRLRFYDA